MSAQLIADLRKLADECGTEAWRGHRIAPRIRALLDAEEARAALAAAEAPAVQPSAELADLQSDIAAALRDLAACQAENERLAAQAVQPATADAPLYEQAMSVLRQIAAMPRRTREQRLASACVSFIEELEKQPSPVTPTPSALPFDGRTHFSGFVQVVGPVPDPMKLDFLELDEQPNG